MRQKCFGKGNCLKSFQFHAGFSPRAKWLRNKTRSIDFVLGIIATLRCHRAL